MPRKKKEDRPKRAQIFYTYDEGCIGGGEPLSDEEWCSYSDEEWEWSLGEVVLQKPEGTLYWNPLEVLDCEDVSEYETLFVVIVRYSTGDTFRHARGKGQIAGAFVDWDNAEELGRKIAKGSDTYKECSSHCDRSWDCYFGGVEDCYVEEVPLKETCRRKKSMMW